MKHLLVLLLVFVATVFVRCQDLKDVDLDMQGAAIHSNTGEGADIEDDIADNKRGDEKAANENNADDESQGDGDQDGTDDDGDTDTAKEGYGYQPPPTKKVYVPVYVPEQEKKKMKIISVDKGFYVQGGMQLFGKFKSLKHCMKACAATPTCFQGDYNPWLHKCYQHTNYTACQTLKSHPQFIHFSKVPCSVTDAPRGRVVLGASMANGAEQKGIDSLSNCIKKCTASGNGIPATVLSITSFPVPLRLFLKAIASDAAQSCFAIDYDFATHKCFFFQTNIANIAVSGTNTILLHCDLGKSILANSQGLRSNPTVVHITFCPKPVG
jgi:hypothetical protein